MLHYFKFSGDVADPVAAREAYVKRGPGKGWPEECPPVRAANAFGWDVLASFDLTFLRGKDGSWRLEEDVELESDWLYSPGEKDPGNPHGQGPGRAPPASRRGREAASGHSHEHSHEHSNEHAHEHSHAGPDGAESEGVPMVQKGAWFWDKDQTLPHVISKEVYPAIRNQAKVSTFLFIRTDPNELLYITDLPNITRPFRVVSALVDTDWYPASYPWHCVIELDPAHERVVIERGSPLCRLLIVRRDTYFAREMSTPEFEAFFQRGQEWLSRHGKGEPGEMMDITRRYSHQQQKSKFTVII